MSLYLPLYYQTGANSEAKRYKRYAAHVKGTFLFHPLLGSGWAYGHYRDSGLGAPKKGNEED